MGEQEKPSLDLTAIGRLDPVSLPDPPRRVQFRSGSSLLGLLFTSIVCIVVLICGIFFAWLTVGKLQERIPAVEPDRYRWLIALGLMLVWIVVTLLFLKEYWTTICRQRRLVRMGTPAVADIVGKSCTGRFGRRNFEVVFRTPDGIQSASVSKADFDEVVVPDRVLLLSDPSDNSKMVIYEYSCFRVVRD